jgi:hypothetical protein
MKINVNESFKKIDGSELSVPVDGKMKVLTVKDVCVNALLAENEGIPVTAEEKMSRFVLGELIFKAEEEIELKLEDAVLLKKLVGVGYGPLIVGQFFRLLES